MNRCPAVIVILVEITYIDPHGETLGSCSTYMVSMRYSSGSQCESSPHWHSWLEGTRNWTANLQLTESCSTKLAATSCKNYVPSYSIVKVSTPVAAVRRGCPPHRCPPGSPESGSPTADARLGISLHTWTLMLFPQLQQDRREMFQFTNMEHFWDLLWL